ncbi:Gamma-glutamyl-gamma-aminobutyrate hydrolase family protein [Candidatus Cyrtobacter comes]|uniref:Gamma-glutamyl-gamma-aminobutyrate hydrolase family protein n=1 Tax=Candidatus Cyrtobacter comes TaxID=675776 RepID=A0ABU5L6F3_9RICK|nr:gamma-glutamyl-gamma-aminobutyrate hydrolase family protein [Candidatus Cyrtobacter comes]MDZ5761700.1 Gamma-glutamyl-gamma-aminobutyrate hydrolase family protein [Candidatus Cyrtobacter comes]
MNHSAGALFSRPKIAVISGYTQHDGGHHRDQQNFSDAVVSSILKGGGLPVGAFVTTDELKEMVAEYYHQTCDGLMIMGGSLDVDPALYGQKPIAGCRINKIRENFEIRIARKFIESQKPVLGICNGEQLLNVIFGGTLFQKMENEHIKRRPESPSDLCAFHNISILQDSWLYSVLKRDRIIVNSSHKQCVDRLGTGFVATSYAPDNFVTSIEMIGNGKFIVGIQWHPEYSSFPNAMDILEKYELDATTEGSIVVNNGALLLPCNQKIIEAFIKIVATNTN